METIDPNSSFKPVKRLNANLPDSLAYYVGEITSSGGLYETPSEFIRDLIRRHMEKAQATEQQEINALLRQSLAENDYSPLTKQDSLDVLEAIKK